MLNNEIVDISDGSFRVGDIVKKDEHGFLRHLSRENAFYRVDKVGVVVQMLRSAAEVIFYDKEMLFPGPAPKPL